MCIVLLVLINSVCKNASATRVDGELCTAGFKGAILIAACVNGPPPQRNDNCDVIRGVIL